MTAGVLVDLSNVTRTYGGVRVLDSVSMAIRPGVTVVIGPNGSGKSTLLGSIAGTIDPTAGDVRYTGPDAARRIGYLPQRIPFRDGFTARETIAFYASLVDEPPDETLERVGLTDAADRRVEALSGGMRRLLGIAQATVGDPPLVVLDEPASGLDPGMRERAFEVATSRASESTAVVVSSHDLDLVDRHTDDVVLLHRGRVAAAGSRESLLNEYGVADVEELYRAIIEDGGRTDDEPEAVHVAGVSDR
ncbi:ABC transporter ATP-binding protein [Halorubrum sp. DTA98]|uniref:ABC transporter ATP-binding protein n=1 Tax=Halorubrum sp. DTA98 TaxID=3402163 RepID=UPI003AAAB1AC